MWWSWILACYGSLGLFFVGRKQTSGLVIMLSNECLWFVYSFTTHQYGFVFGGTLYTIMYFRAYLKWRKKSE